MSVSQSMTYMFKNIDTFERLLENELCIGYTLHKIGNSLMDQTYIQNINFILLGLDSVKNSYYYIGFKYNGFYYRIIKEK